MAVLHRFYCISNIVLTALLVCATCQPSLIRDGVQVLPVVLLTLQWPPQILQICLIMALLCCKHRIFGMVIDQFSLAGSITLCMQELYIWSQDDGMHKSAAAPLTTCRWFSCIVTSNLQPRSGKRVTQVAKGSYHLQLVRSHPNLTLQSAVNRVGSSFALCALII